MLWRRKDFGSVEMASIGFWCDGNGVKHPRSNRKNGGKFKFSFLKKRLYLCYLWVYWAEILSVVSFSKFHYHFWHFQWLARSIKVWPRKRREIKILLWLSKAQSHQANKLPFSWTLKDMSQRRRGGISASGRMYILIYSLFYCFIFVKPASEPKNTVMLH